MARADKRSRRASLDYENFDLLVEKVGEVYRARVVAAPRGEAAITFDHPPFSRDELERLRQHVEDPGAVWDWQAQKAFEEIGKKLFEAVFSGPVKDRFREARAFVEAKKRDLRLRIMLDGELELWPWEYLWDPETRSFLSRSEGISIVRYLPAPRRPRPLRARLPLRILVVAPERPGDDSLGVEEERSRLKSALSDLIRKGHVILKQLRPATLAALNERLRKEQFHILHFVGHGRFDPRKKRGFLAFEEDLIDGTDLGSVLARNRIPLVVLNSCQGARGDPQDMFSGVGQSLVFSGVTAVVAMQFKISDRAAITFAAGFYESLASGHLIDDAVLEARRSLFAERYGAEWGNPVLYMRSVKGRLFKVKAPNPSLEKLARWWKEHGSPIVRWSPASLLLLFPSLQGAAPATLCPSLPGLDLEFSLILPGSFTMGTGEKRHIEVVVKSFCMGRYEVTRAQWAAVMGGGSRPEDGNLPVTVSWDEAQSFLEKLNRMYPGSNFRLPSEKQWEYGARAGSRALFSFGDDVGELYMYGNCNEGDGYEGLAPVGSFEQNDWGLYDMHGNVWEWVTDEAPPDKPGGPMKRIRRGGSFRITPKNCSSVYIADSKPDRRASDVGFRIVCDRASPENKGAALRPPQDPR